MKLLIITIITILRASFSHASSLPQSEWAGKAAMHAEKASAQHCNGNGDLFTDTYHPQNNTTCECFECFTGPYCDQPISDCYADVESGDPLLYEPFWKENAEESAVVIPGWYRMSYSYVEGFDYAITPGLEAEIRKLHKVVGNAVSEGRFIVVGTGSTQLLNAAVSSLSPHVPNQEADVVAAVPYYGAYREQTQLFETHHYMWAGDAYTYASTTHPLNDSSIEFVTSPNNPDNFIHNPLLHGSKAFSIYDHAYYWPHFTAVTKPSDHDVMLFTLTKVSGHAGTRIGWAIVKDKAIYAKMANYVSLNTNGVSHESQLRATQILKVINSGYSSSSSRKKSINLEAKQYAKDKLIFHYAYAKLKYRWETLSKVLNGSDFKLQSLQPVYNPFFRQISHPSPAYAWVQCNGVVRNCSEIFPKAGIKGRIGSIYGSTDQYIRFSLLKRDSTFDNLIKRLIKVVSDN